MCFLVNTALGKGDKRFDIKFFTKKGQRYFIVKSPLGFFLKVIKFQEYKEIKTKSFFFASRRAYTSFISVLRNLFSSSANGYCVDLRINGVGYKVEAYRYNSFYELGHSHYILYKLLTGLFVGKAKYRGVLFGRKKESVYFHGRELKNLSYPDSYKGKGFRFSFETLILKVGKQRQR